MSWPAILMWLKNSWQWLVGILAVLLGISYLRRQQKRADSYGAVVSAREEIARLSGEREQLKERVDEKDQLIVEIDKQLIDNKRLIIETLHPADHPESDQEIEARFKELGY